MRAKSGKRRVCGGGFGSLDILHACIIPYCDGGLLGCCASLSRAEGGSLRRQRLVAAALGNSESG